MQISSISSNNSEFPDVLRNLDNPPKSINVLGTLPRDTKMVAIVGTRDCTTYGQRVTYQLASELAKAGIVIVSGLAFGVDSIAHQAAVDADARTIAVLGHGLGHMYPAEHRDLAKDILAKGGALVSEYDPGVPPDRFRFPERNRIIAALADITIVVESAVKGGSLLTAHEATKIGRQVMAVPGNITSEFSVGPNNLIATGEAAPVISSTDVITALGFIAHEAVPVSAQSPDEAMLLDLLGTGTGTNEDLIERSGLTAAQFANVISLMEITGKVRNLGAGQWVRK
jgi:DNA processing protein